MGETDGHAPVTEVSGPTQIFRRLLTLTGDFAPNRVPSPGFGRVTGKPKIETAGALRYRCALAFGRAE
jgi:hypothetical protein